MESARITLNPKSLVDRNIAEGLEDFKKGRSIGPFETADAAVKAASTDDRTRGMKVAFLNRSVLTSLRCRRCWRQSG